MIVRCYRGGKAVGLSVYLFGPGRRNEHTNPHLLGGHEAITGLAPDGEPTRAQAAELGRALELPTKVFGTKVRQAVKARNETEQSQVTTAYRDAHVYHVALSLDPSEAPLSDDKWTAIATELVGDMGFAGEGVDGAQCRWMVVRHGLSSGGNDHVHLVVNLVREDGTKANLHNDFRKLQASAARLERAHGLRVIETREAKRASLSANHAAELGKVERGAATAPARDELRRRMHAVAVASHSEQEYLEGLKNARVLVRPRYAKGSTSKVVGYSVALPPTFSGGRRQDPVWYAPSKLDRTLGLGQLRMRWGAGADSGADLGPQWRAQWKEAAVTDRIDVRAAPEIGTVAFARLNERMSASEEQAAAADVAGILARASLIEEKGQPGPFARASEEFARIAQPHTYDPIAPTPAAKARALMDAAYKARLLGRVTGADRTSGWMALLRQTQRTAAAVARAHAARGYVQRAESARTAADAAFETLPAARPTRPTPAPAVPVRGSRLAPTPVVRADRGCSREGGVDQGAGR